MERFHARKGEFKNTVEDFSALVFFQRLSCLLYTSDAADE